MLIIVIIWIIAIICNYFIYHVFKQELSKIAMRRAAQALDDDSLMSHVWPENDASEKNKAKTGKLSKSNVCNSSAAGRLWRRELEMRVGLIDGFWLDLAQVKLACPRAMLTHLEENPHHLAQLLF